jgi:hypothetical protein
MGSPGSRQGEERSAFCPAELAGSAHFLPGVAFSQIAKCKLIQSISGAAALARRLRLIV